MPRKIKNAPVAFIKRLQRTGVLTITPENDPVSISVVQEVLDAIWNDEWYVRRILMHLPPGKRKIIIAEPSLNKIDRYVLNLYLNLKEDEKITTTKVIAIVKSYFKVEYSKDQVKYIRQKVYDARRGKGLGNQF